MQWFRTVRCGKLPKIAGVWFTERDDGRASWRLQGKPKKRERKQLTREDLMQDVWLTGQPDAQRRITFKLDSGRLVWVVTFRYRGTYDGLLEGRPTDEINRQIVEAELKTARRAGSGAVQLLAPPTRTDDRGGVYLPPVCCRAELESSPMNREMHGSSLIVVTSSRSHCVP
jgi:hypothetical protein